MITIESIQTLNNGSGSIVVPSGLTNSALVVAGGTHQGNFSTVTYGGNSLTNIATGHSSLNENGELWIILNPTAGSATLTVNTDGGSWWGAICYIVAGVKQTTSPVSGTNNGSSSSASATVATPTGNVLIIAAMGSEANSTGNTPTRATRTDLQGQSFENGSGLWYFLKTGEVQTPTFSLSSGQRWGCAVTALVEPDANLGAEFATNRHIEVSNGMSRTDSAT